MAEVVVMLRRNLRLIGSFALAVVLVVWWLLRYETPAYQSSAALRLADARMSVAGGFEQSQLDGETDPFLSELEVLRSRSVAREVVDAEGLRLHVLRGPHDVHRVLRDVRVAPDASLDTLHLRFSGRNATLISPRWNVRGPYGTPLESPDGHIRMRVIDRLDADVFLEILSPEIAIDLLLDELIVSPRPPTNIVDVHFTASDPGVAQRVLSRLTSIFQAANAERAQQQSRRRREFLEAQITRNDSTLLAKQLALSAFRGRESLYSARDRMQAEQANLTDIELRRRELATEIGTYQSLLDRLQRAATLEEEERLRELMGAPSVAGNLVIDRLYAQLLDYQSQRDALTTGRWGSSSSNPDVQRLSSLIASTQERITSTIGSHLTSLHARMAALEEVEARGVRASRDLPQAEAEEVRLVQQVETVRRMGDQLREEYQRAQVVEAVEVGQVEILDEATLPHDTVNVTRSVKLGIALLLGLLLGCGAAVARELLDSTVRRHGEIATKFNLPQLGIIPRIEDIEAGRPQRLRLTAGHQGSASTALPSGASSSSVVPSQVDEAFRALRTNLMFAAHVEGVRTLVVTSSFPQEGKSMTACSLARAFARQGIRTLLADGDLRRPTLHALFGVPQEPGLSEVLRGQCSRDEVVRTIESPNLHLLTAGALPLDSTELLAGERMRAFVQEIPDDIGLMIVDSPPLLSAADASALSAKADAVLLVVRAGRTARGALKQAVDQLDTVGARIAGVVLNDPETKVSRYADHYGAYGYDYAAGSSAVLTPHAT